jgi:DNA-binding Lrp family transcriptional regulator
MDAYVFVRDADDATLGALQELAGRADETGVRFASSISGAYDAFVAVQGDDLAAIEESVRVHVRGAGAVATETALVLPPVGPLGPIPKGMPPDEVEAFVRITVEPGRAGDVLAALQGLTGFMGAAIIGGEFDILAEIGGATFEDVAGTLLNELHTIDGIASSRSAFAHFEAPTT